MSLNLDGDIDTMMADALGVDVTIGAVTGRGLLDISDAIEQHGDGLQVQVRVTSLLVRTGVFTLSDNVAVTAGGVSYLGRAAAPEDDGKLTRIVLRRVS